MRREQAGGRDRGPRPHAEPLRELTLRAAPEACPGPPAARDGRRPPFAARPQAAGAAGLDVGQLVEVRERLDHRVAGRELALAALTHGRRARRAPRSRVRSSSDPLGALDLVVGVLDVPNCPVSSATWVTARSSTRGPGSSRAVRTSRRASRRRSSSRRRRSLKPVRSAARSGIAWHAGVSCARAGTRSLRAAQRTGTGALIRAPARS